MVSPAAGWGLAAALTVLLFLGYLRVSWTVAATSDGAAQALQARDMLAGNWLLHEWTLSDVSCYTTELPEYMLVELTRPFGVRVIHLAATATYTLLVLAVFALARGRARRAKGLLRGLLAAGIMLAPQPGYGAFVLLLSPDHVGTQVPLLLGWLLLELRPRHRWIPVVMCLLLAWVQLADRVTLVTAVLPLVIVCAARRWRDPQSPWGRAWRRRRYELLLASTAVGSAVVAWVGARALAAAGGFTARPLPFTLAPLRLLWTHAWLTGRGILELYGANFSGVSGWAGFAFAALHLVGLAAAATGTAIALCRFLRSRAALPPLLVPSAQFSEAWGIESAPGGALSIPHAGQERDVGQERAAADLVDSVLAVAIVANLVSYVLSIEPGTTLGTGYSAREIAAVLPLGAVLAGRVLGPKLAKSMKLTGRFHEISRDVAARQRPTSLDGTARKTGVLGLGLALVLAGYVAAFGWAAAQPAAGSQDARLAQWLVRHGLRYGLGGASANVLTVLSGGRAVVAPVTTRQGRVIPLLYQSPVYAYDPARHNATFLLAETPGARPGDPVENVPGGVVLATFGLAQHVYRFAGYTIEVWDVNLLTKLHE